LARALLFAKDKDVMLLDESTSSVDPENEQRIYENIFNEFKGKTILASIHKMNLLKFFDKIVMFSNGKIVDVGTFDELLIRNEKFARDWREFIKMSK
jgi:ATP-binding cassette subfamily B protein